MEFGELVGEAARQLPALYFSVLLGFAFTSAFTLFGMALVNDFSASARRSGIRRGARGPSELRLSPERRGVKPFAEQVIWGVMLLTAITGTGFNAVVEISNAVGVILGPLGLPQSYSSVAKVGLGILVMAFWVDVSTRLGALRHGKSVRVLEFEEGRVRSPVVDTRVSARRREVFAWLIIGVRRVEGAFDAASAFCLVYLFAVLAADSGWFDGSENKAVSWTIAAFVVVGFVVVVAVEHALLFAVRRLFLRLWLLRTIAGILSAGERKQFVLRNRGPQLADVARSLSAYTRRLDQVAPAGVYPPEATILWELHRRLIDHLSSLDALRPRHPAEVDRLLRDISVLVVGPDSWETHRDLTEHYLVTVDRKFAGESRPAVGGRLSIFIGRVTSHVEQAHRLVVGTTAIAVIVVVAILLLLGRFSFNEGLPLLR